MPPRPKRKGKEGWTSGRQWVRMRIYRKKRRKIVTTKAQRRQRARARIRRLGGQLRDATRAGTLERRLRLYKDRQKFLKKKRTRLTRAQRLQVEARSTLRRKRKRPSRKRKRK